MRVCIDEARHQNASWKLEHSFGPLLLAQLCGLAEFDDGAAFHDDGALGDRRPVHGKDPIGL
jgi:hypothetical protein